jgi:DNA polymerase-1
MPVYDANTPVRPTPEGRHADDHGREFVAGAAFVKDALAELLNTGQPLGVDIETVGTDELSFQIKVVTIGTPRLVVALDPRDPMQANLCLWTMREAPALIFHGATFDIPPMVFHKLMDLDSINKVHDTLVYARMAEPDRMVDKSLTGCVKRYLGASFDSDATIKAAFKAAGHKTLAAGFANVDIDAPVYLRSACMDTALTAELAPILWQACITRMTTGHPFVSKGVDHAEAARVIEREQIVNRVFLRRSAIGLPVDTDFLDQYRDTNEAEAMEAGRFLEDLELTPGNGGHLTKYLDRIGALPADWPRTAKTKAPSAKAENLETLDHPVVERHLKFLELRKITGYLEKCEAMARVTGRVHPQVKILGASATGRMSYSSPELHQFPGPARGIIVAESGRSMTSIDWSSIEPVVMANAAHDVPIYEAFEQGGDLYAPVVETTGVSRKRSKVVLLGTMYGEGIASMAYDLKVDEDEAARIKASVMGAMPGIKQFLYRLKTVGNEAGMGITISGRIVHVPKGFDGKNKGYLLQNYFCQGSAYDVLAEAVLECYRQGLADYIILAMHDELVVDTEAAEAVRRIMETPPPALIRWAERVPMLRTDMAHMGRAWASV